VREALASTLLKDEAERGVFDDAFAQYFGGGRGPLREGGRRAPSRSGLIGIGGDSGGAGSAQPERARPVPPLLESGTRRQDAAQSHSPTEPQTQAKTPDERHTGGEAAPSAGPASPSASDNTNADGNEDSTAARHDTLSPGRGTAELLAALEKAIAGARSGDASDSTAAGRAARLRETERLPFAGYDDLAYQQARDILKVLRRRLRARLARRLRIAGDGRIDFRRTVRAATQHGGILAELRFRNRRPRHLDLLLLGDVSGSMRYAAVLMLELMAGAQDLFRHVRSFVYIDSLAEAGFELGHLVTVPAVDFMARSDFGKVLTELWERRAALVSRASIIVIIGDGRNNRRPPRAEILRDLRRGCRSVIWLNPEPPERWGTGDSAIARYARAADQLVACGNLEALERSLASAV